MLEAAFAEENLALGSSCRRVEYFEASVNEARDELREMFLENIYLSKE